jgi:hypothetical protein
MKYTIEVEDYGDVELSREVDGIDDVRLGIREGDEYEYVVLSKKEFQELRKAVGYVWGEVHPND